MKLPALRPFAITLFVLAASGGPAPAAWFIRGDADGDGKVCVTDAIRILQFLLQGDAAAVGCEDAADVDDTGAIDLADVVSLLGHLFAGDSPPGPNDLLGGCRFDPTEDFRPSANRAPGQEKNCEK